MQEGVGHIDYPRGSSDYPISGGKRGLGKDAFVPIEDLSSGESPEDLLLQKEQGELNDDDQEKRKREVEYINRLDERRNPAPLGSRQGGGELVGSRKAVLLKEGVLTNTRDIKGQKRNDGRKPRSKN